MNHDGDQACARLLLYAAAAALGTSAGRFPTDGPGLAALARSMQEVLGDRALVRASDSNGEGVSEFGCVGVVAETENALRLVATPPTGGPAHRWLTLNANGAITDEAVSVYG